MRPERTLEEIFAELCNAITPVMLLPEEATKHPDADTCTVPREAVEDALASTERVRDLLNEMRAWMNGSKQ